METAKKVPFLVATFLGDLKKNLELQKKFPFLSGQALTPPP